MKRKRAIATKPVYLAAVTMASVLTVAFVNLSNVAEAHDFGNCTSTSGCVPEDKFHGACWVPDPDTTIIPFASWWHVFGYLDDEVADETGIDISWHTSCPGGRDMRMTDEYSSSANLGLTTPTNCSGSGSSAVCNGHVVAVNAIRILGWTQGGDTIPSGTALFCSAITDRQLLAQKVWCHESGHSLGAGHNSGSHCMNTGCLTWTEYRDNDLWHFEFDL